MSIGIDDFNQYCSLGRMVRRVWRKGVPAFGGLVLSLACGEVGAADTRSGAEIYKLHCIMCHGDKGRGVMPSAPRFDRGDGLFQSDESLLNRVQDGDKACPSYQGVLRDSEILDVIAYIRMFY